MSPLERAGVGCVALLLLVVGGLLLAVLSWQLELTELLLRAERDHELRQADSAAVDVLKVELFARAGLDAFLAAGPDYSPPSPSSGVLGQSYQHGEDRYVITYRKLEDGVVAVEIRGEIWKEDWAANPPKQLVASALVTAQVAQGELVPGSLDVSEGQLEPRQ